MPKINANGIDIYYEIHGEEKSEPLIFANGIFANTLSWFNQTPVFSKEYHVILYDMRGQGQSDKPDAPYSFDLHAEDQKALLEELGIKKVHHIGISYGAELGMVFGLKYPEMLKSLTICSAVSYSNHILHEVGMLWRKASVLADPDLFFSATLPFNFSETFIRNNPKFFEEAKARYADLDYPSFVKLLDAFLELNITEQLSRIDIPSCVIVGESDFLKPPFYSKLIHKKLPNSEMVIIPDSGHVVTWEKPEEFNKIVLEFLGKHIH